MRGRLGVRFGREGKAVEHPGESGGDAGVFAGFDAGGDAPGLRAVGDEEAGEAKGAGSHGPGRDNLVGRLAVSLAWQSAEDALPEAGGDEALTLDLAGPVYGCMACRRPIPDDSDEG